MSYSHICASKIVIMLRFIHAYTILSVDKMLQCKKYSDTTSGKDINVSRQQGKICEKLKEPQVGNGGLRFVVGH